MKNSTYILLVFVLLFSSCLKQIDLSLDDDEQRTVIDTRLYLGTNDFDVKLAKSGNYFGSNSIKEITDASVSLFDGAVSYTLDNMGNGLYRLPDFTTYESQEYKLTIEENGNKHEASAEMVSLVSLDSLTFEYVEAIFEGDEDGFEAFIEVQDPENFHNYYMIESRVNNESEFDGFIVFDDEFVDGNDLYFSVVFELLEFDLVDVDLISINKETYDYYNQLQLAINGDGAAPANPDNNFGKEVLGNFSVMAVSRKSGIVQ